MIKMSFRNNYHTGVNQHQIPEDLTAITKYRMKNQIKYKKSKIRWCVAIPVCGVVMLFSVSALAYGITFGFTKSAYEPIINSDVPSEAMQEAGNEVQKTIDQNDMVITVKSTVCDNNLMVISLDAKSKDGTPLLESSEFRKSFLPRNGFTNTSLQIGQKQYDCYLFRTDDGSVPDQASFEGQVFGNFKNQNGADAVLMLEDYTDEVCTGEDAGFLFDNLGELYEQMTPESPENFIQTGLYGVYADESLFAPSWTIPTGKHKLKFSSQLPNSYIDNIGFHKTGEYGCQRDLLYISITPGNDKEAEQIKKLCFQNLTTMNFVYFEDFIITGNGAENYIGYQDRLAALNADRDRKLSMNGNRIVIALSLFYDSNTLTRDLTVKDLYYEKL
jgi:hypothetical protein